MEDSTYSEIDQFTVELGLLRFQRTDGQISGFKFDSDRLKNLTFRKITGANNVDNVQCLHKVGTLISTHVMYKAGLSLTLS